MEILLAFIIFSFLFAGMAIGLMVKGKPLKGSCGGVAALMGNETCDLCGGNPNKCEELQDQASSQQTSVDASLAYEAKRD